MLLERCVGVGTLSRAAPAYSEALSFPSSPVFPSTCPMGRSRRGRRAAAGSLLALKGLTPTEET